MKKTILYAAAFAALSLTSCQKEYADQKADGIKLVPMTFTASIEDAGTKALIDGLKTYWAAGDQISICPMSDVSKTPAESPYLTAQSAGASTTFTGQAPEGLSTYYAFYPKSALTKWNDKTSSDPSRSTVAVAKIKSTQDWACIGQSNGKDVFIDPDELVLVGTAGEDLNFTFRHAFCYIKFELNEEQAAALKLRTVTVMDAPKDITTGQTLIAGTINIVGNKNWTVGVTGSTKSTAARYQAGTGANVNLPAGIYYIAMFPRSSGTLYKNICIKFQNSGGKAKYFYVTPSVADDFKFYSGSVVALPEIPTTIFQ